MESTYKPIYLHIIYQRKNLLLMNAKANPGWDYHVPPDHRMVEPILPSTIHPHVIFQA